MSDNGIAGYRTTFHAMFGAQDEGTPRVDQVKIPLIQRDYAQGREDARTSAIRSRFLDAIHTALTGTYRSGSTSSTARSATAHSSRSTDSSGSRRSSYCTGTSPPAVVRSTRRSRGAGSHTPRVPALFCSASAS